MNNPGNLYMIAKQCYSCHTVPNEALVKVGGHKAGSQDFELVSWSQGMVRHNFVRGGGANASPTREQLRVMYIVGVMTDLEFSLRATAEATQNATFGRTCASRAARMKRQLREIQQQINNPHVARALDAVATVELRLRNAAAIVAAADGVATAAHAFAEQADGSTLASVDRWLPDPSRYRGQ
jgi:hypothetical protein